MGAWCALLFLSPWHPNIHPSPAAPQSQIMPAIWAPGATGLQRGGDGVDLPAVSEEGVPILCQGVGVHPCQVCSHVGNLPGPWRPLQGSPNPLSFSCLWGVPTPGLQCSKA